MARLNIPHKTLVAIADRLVEQPKAADYRKAGKSSRCPSKVTILRRLMEADGKLYGRVVELAKEYTADTAKAEAAKQGFTVRPESETHFKGYDDGDCMFTNRPLDPHWLGQWEQAAIARRDSWNGLHPDQKARAIDFQIHPEDGTDYQSQPVENYLTAEPNRGTK